MFYQFLNLIIGFQWEVYLYIIYIYTFLTPLLPNFELKKYIYVCI